MQCGVGPRRPSMLKMVSVAPPEASAAGASLGSRRCGPPGPHPAGRAPTRRGARPRSTGSSGSATKQSCEGHTHPVAAQALDPVLKFAPRSVRELVRSPSRTSHTRNTPEPKPARTFAGVWEPGGSWVRGPQTKRMIRIARNSDRRLSGPRVPPTRCSGAKPQFRGGAARRQASLRGPLAINLSSAPIRYRSGTDPALERWRVCPGVVVLDARLERTRLDSRGPTRADARGSVVIWMKSRVLLG